MPISGSYNLKWFGFTHNQNENQSWTEEKYTIQNSFDFILWDSIKVVNVFYDAT